MGTQKSTFLLFPKNDQKHFFFKTNPNKKQIVYRNSDSHERQYNEQQNKLGFFGKKKVLSCFHYIKVAKLFLFFHIQNYMPFLHLLRKKWGNQAFNMKKTWFSSFHQPCSKISIENLTIPSFTFPIASFTLTTSRGYFPWIATINTGILWGSPLLCSSDTHRYS